MIFSQLWEACFAEREMIQTQGGIVIGYVRLMDMRRKCCTDSLRRTSKRTGVFLFLLFLPLFFLFFLLCKLKINGR
jgi:hypothetical protein